jgi:polyhydroxybutyrate depolymerase
MKFRHWYDMRSMAAGGCLAAMIFAPTLWAQQTKEKVTVDDVERDYSVRLPKGYDAKQHYPVVVLLHGLNQEADDVQRLTRFDELADKDSVITVYPSALHGRWNIGVRAPEQQRPMGMGPGRRRGGYGYPGGGYPGGGYPGGGRPGGGGQQDPNRRPNQDRTQTPVDDISFFSQMLDKLGTTFSVDSSRIYAAGLSDGGFMSLHLGCALSDRFAAVAAVGAAMPKTLICLPSRPVPLIMINGTEDPIVHYGGGTEKNRNLPIISVEDSAKAWAKIYRCEEKPEHSKLPKSKGGMETKVDTYNGCQQNAQVVLYSVKGGGNTWPGGEQYEVEKTIGKTSEDLNANEVIWSFFATRKLPGEAAEKQVEKQDQSAEKK